MGGRSAVPYEPVDAAVAEANAPWWAQSVASSLGSEPAAAAPEAGLLAPYRGQPPAVRHARLDFERAARTVPLARLQGALADQLLQDGGQAFAQRVARIFAWAAPWLRNEIVAELLIGCGPCARAGWPTEGDCSVHTLAELALARTPGAPNQIAELCCRFPALAMALDHADLANVVVRLARPSEPT